MKLRDAKYEIRVQSIPTRISYFVSRIWKEVMRKERSRHSLGRAAHENRAK